MQASAKRHSRPNHQSTDQQKMCQIGPPFSFATAAEHSDDLYDSQAVHAFLRRLMQCDETLSEQFYIIGFFTCLT